MHARRALAVVPAVLIALAAPALSAPKTAPQILDPKGDSAAGQAGLDVVSVEYKTSGIGAGKAYVPKKLTVALTLAGPPLTQGVVSYTLLAETDSCGRFEIRYSPGNATGTVIGDTTASFGSCAETIFMPAKVKGSVVTFDFALKAIGLDRGTEFSGFTANVDLTDPALGTIGTDIVGPTTGVGDTASGDGTWLVP